jgi:hypothetical protein
MRPREGKTSRCDKFRTEFVTRIRGAFLQKDDGRKTLREVMHARADPQERERDDQCLATTTQMPNIASDVCDHLVRVPLRYVEQRARVSSRRSHVAPEVEPQPSLHVSVHTSVLNRRNVNEMNVGVLSS